MPNGALVHGIRLKLLTVAVLFVALASAADRVVTVAITGQPSREAAVAAGPAVPVAAIAFHPGGNLLATTGYREVLLWDLGSARLARRLGAGKLTGNIRALAFSPDGRVLAVSDGVPGVSGAVRLIDVESGELNGSFEPAKDEIAAIAFSPDGRSMLAGDAAGEVRVWNVADRRPVETLKKHSGPISTIAFSPDAKYLATGSGDKTVHVWDTNGWKPLVQLPQVVTEPVTAAAFSPDSESLAFVTGGDNERAVRVWRTEFAPEPKEGDPAAPRLRFGRRITRPLDLWTCSPLGLAWARGIADHPNAAHRTPRIYVACTDRMVRVLSANGGFIGTLNGHQDWVQSVAVSSDGMRIAAGSLDGTVKVWNRVDGALLATFIHVKPGADEWAIVTPRGWFASSIPAAIEWRGVAKAAAQELSVRLRNDEAVRNILAGGAPSKAASVGRTATHPKPRGRIRLLTRAARKHDPLSRLPLTEPRPSRSGRTADPTTGATE